jgi:hypothetical protein
MKMIALIALLSLPGSSFAAGEAETSLSGAFGSAQATLPVVSMRDVNACFAREDGADADRLGLPKKFCLSRVGTKEPADAVTPFENEGEGLVEGSPAAGLKHISGGSRRADGGWDIVMDLFHAPAAAPSCGRLNDAFAAVYFSVDAVGRPIGGAVEVRGFLLDESFPCAKPADSPEILYRRLP